MTGETTLAGCAGQKTHRAAIDWRVIYRPFPLKSAHISGRVLGADLPQKSAGETQTLIRLATLLAEAKHARNLRKSRKASLIECELRAMRHAILREGVRR